MIWGLVSSEESTHTDTHQSGSTVLCVRVLGASSSLGLLEEEAPLTTRKGDASTL